MESIIRSVKDIEADDRRSLEHVVGQQLQDNQEVLILLLSPHAAPPANDRQSAFQRISQVLDKSADAMKNVPDSEFDEAVDEAISHIRKRGN